MFLTKLNEVLTSKNSFISDRLNAVSLGIGLLINIIHWALLFIKIKPGEGSILLHYNVVYGPDFVDKSSYAYTIPGVALLMLLINLGLAYYLYRREKLVSYFLNFAGIPIQLIFLVASLALIAVNG